MKAIMWSIGLIFSLITAIVSANSSAGVVGRNIHDGPGPAAGNTMPPELINNRTPPGWTHGHKRGWNKTVTGKGTLKNKPVKAL